MSDPREEALASVGSVIAQLESMGDPGPKWREENGGWTTEARAACLRAFARIRDQLLDGGTDFRHEAHHLVRELDHWSVIGGPVLEEAARLQRRLRELLEAEGLLPERSMVVTFVPVGSVNGEPVGIIVIRDEHDRAAPAPVKASPDPQEARLPLSEARALAAALGYEFREN